ncbi:hypothetical protein CSKR_103727 [Clonorchis sinensis]|uniref:Uncharacterized protein n=1 Tax=Clonorchis sinensis TaxID=79923 RepID=A0A419QEI8_CLOSI|nr:hypothetical protein CSKR_103727 [Clonorchis sinensis]
MPFGCQISLSKPNLFVNECISLFPLYFIALPTLSASILERLLSFSYTVCFGETIQISRNTLICKSIWFCERLTWNPAESLACDVLRQLNVLHQAASCSSCYDIRDIAIHNIRLTETRGLRLPDEPQQGRNRSWAVEEFSATL